MGAWRVVHQPDSTHEGFDLLQLIRPSNLFKNATHRMLSTPLLADVASEATATVKDRKPGSTLRRSVPEAKLGRLQEGTEMFPIFFHKKQRGHEFNLGFSGGASGGQV